MAIRLREREAVVVGGGLAAGLIARRLVPAGKDVLVLERGQSASIGPESTLPNQRDELRWSIHRGLTQRENVETYTLRHGTSEQSLPMRRLLSFLPGIGVGGAANHWNGATFRFQTTDQELRTHLTRRYGASSIPQWMTIQDWGISYKELEPYYTLFDKLFGISGKAGNVRGQSQAGGNPFEPWRSEEYPLPPLESSEAGLIFKDASEKLGYKPFPMPAANASRAYVNPDGMRLAACQYCGHCERFVCEANAKASPRVLLYPLVAGKPNFEVRANAEVFRLLYDPQAKRVTGVLFTDTMTGEEYEQPASTVVLASYVMSNTRLLLLSGIGKPYAPQQGGVVGKNYCFQVTSAVQVFFENRYINPFMGAGALGMVIDEFNNDHFDHSGLGFVGGAYIAVFSTNGRPIVQRLLPPGTPRWGSDWKRANAKWYLRSFGILCHGSSYAHRDHYMDLDPDYRDAFGRPLLRITYDFDENDTRMSAFVTAKAHEIAKATGATVVGPAATRRGPFDSRFYQSTHNTGGTIMGSDPETSVVSPRLQCWDASNLFIVGASVFPQNSGYNPTGPVGALALRLGDDLLSYLARPRTL